MYLTLAVMAIFYIGMWFVTRKLRSFVGGMNAPRDIREEESLAKRVAVAGFGVLSPVGNPQDNLATIFKFGRKDARTEGTASVFRATAGWRYGFLLVLPLLAWFTVYIESQTDIGGQTPYNFYLLIALGLAYTGVYIWRFRLVIDGIDMTCTSNLLMTRQFDLSKLVRAQTKQDGYTLYFEDGRKIAIPRFVEGHDLLKDFLIGQLEDNGH